MADKYVLVCQNADCKARNAEQVMVDLCDRLKDSPSVEVKSYMCFGACQTGPNIVMYPEKVWYSRVKKEDVADIASHAEGGPPIDRLTQGVEPSLQELVYQLLDAGLF